MTWEYLSQHMRFEYLSHEQVDTLALLLETQCMDVRT